MAPLTVDYGSQSGRTATPVRIPDA